MATVLSLQDAGTALGVHSNTIRRYLAKCPSARVKDRVISKGACADITVLYPWMVEMFPDDYGQQNNLNSRLEWVREAGAEVTRATSQSHQPHQPHQSNSDNLPAGNHDNPDNQGEVIDVNFTIDDDAPDNHGNLPPNNSDKPSNDNDLPMMQAVGAMLTKLNDVEAKYNNELTLYRQGCDRELVLVKDHADHDRREHHRQAANHKREIKCRTRSIYMSLAAVLILAAMVGQTIYQKGQIASRAEIQAGQIANLNSDLTAAQATGLKLTAKIGGLTGSLESVRDQLTAERSALAAQTIAAAARIAAQEKQLAANIKELAELSEKVGGVTAERIAAANAAETAIAKLKQELTDLQQQLKETQAANQIAGVEP